MPEPQKLDIWNCTSEILSRMRSSEGGVLCTVADKAGNQNLLTLGWGLIGPSYYDNPIFMIAVAPMRYSFRFLEELPEFVIAVPNDTIRPAVDLCHRIRSRHGQVQSCWPNTCIECACSTAFNS